MATQRFYVSKSVVTDFNKVVLNLGLVKKFWYSTFLLHEAEYLLWSYHKSNHIGNPKPNSPVALAYLQQRHLGNRPNLKRNVTAIYCDMSDENVDECSQVCDFFTISRDALMEFALSEAVHRVTSVKFTGRGRPDSAALFYLRHAITDKPRIDEKLFRIKEALFCHDGIIPNSFKKQFRKK